MDAARHFLERDLGVYGDSARRILPRRGRRRSRSRRSRLLLLRRAERQWRRRRFPLLLLLLLSPRALLLHPRMVGSLRSLLMMRSRAVRRRRRRRRNRPLLLMLRLLRLLLELEQGVDVDGELWLPLMLLLLLLLPLLLLSQLRRQQKCRARETEGLWLRRGAEGVRVEPLAVHFFLSSKAFFFFFGRRRKNDCEALRLQTEQTRSFFVSSSSSLSLLFRAHAQCGDAASQPSRGSIDVGLEVQRRQRQRQQLRSLFPG